MNARILGKHCLQKDSNTYQPLRILETEAFELQNFIFSSLCQD